MLGPLLLYVALAGSASGCLAVGEPTIKAADLGPVLPGLPDSNKEYVIGSTPEPGVVRWWRGEGLKLLATRLGIDMTTLSEFCVERMTKVYTEDEVTASLQKSVPVGVQAELVDHCRIRVPAGELRFDWRVVSSNPCSGLARPIAWRGQARFTNNRSVPFWALVRLSTERNRILASRDISPGTILKMEDLRQERSIGSPFCTGEVGSLELAEGKETVHRIRSGAAIRVAELREPIDVMNGEFVEVSAANDSTRLQFTARALGRGRKGEDILVQDTVNRRVFRARVTGRKTADVEMDVLVASKPNRAARESTVTLTGSSMHR